MANKFEQPGVPEEEKGEEASVEVLRPETIERVEEALTKTPRLNEGYGYRIPYGGAEQGPLDEETGLYISAHYIPRGSGLKGKTMGMEGLDIWLSTPRFEAPDPTGGGGERNARRRDETLQHVETMAGTLRKLYGSDNPELERKIQGARESIQANYDPKYMMSSDSWLKDMRWHLFDDIGGRVRHGFDTTSRESSHVNEVHLPLLESGGSFLEGVVGRAVETQVQEFESRAAPK